MNTKYAAYSKLMHQFDRELFLDANFYCDWMAQTYFFVRHSTRLLALSAGKTPFELQAFHQRFLAHAAEEKNHDLLLVRDLESFGKSPADFEELPITKVFYRNQYFAIENIHPLSFLGYVYLLESIPVLIGKEILPTLLEKYPKQACSFFKLHCEEDVDHLEKLDGVLNSLPKPIYDSIQFNFEESADLYWRLLEELNSRTLKKLQVA